jgi:hypothetical protein
MKRRLFLKSIATALLATPFIKALAQDPKECPATAPADVKVVTADTAPGKGLAYVALATESKHEKYKAGQNCTNCKFYKADKANGGYAPCTMMANKFVAGCGWCKSYTVLKKA